MIAACPMLQHMENAAVGSHLEVRLSADIKQESVLTFLQYLYEGFMKLTEENCKDVEKIGKLLHVDSVVKCCADFYKCLNSKSGTTSYEGMKFDTMENGEFRHVRTTDMEKTLPDGSLKRSSDLPSSPGGKRQRISRPSSPPVRSDDRLSMSHSYSTQDPFERVPRLGSGMQQQRPTNVIEIAEDGVEVVSSDPRERDAEGWPKQTDLPPIQHSMGISVTGQVTNETDLQIVNITGADQSQTQPQRRSSANLDPGSRRGESGAPIPPRQTRPGQYGMEGMYPYRDPSRQTDPPPHRQPDAFGAIQRPTFQSTPIQSKPTQPPPLKSAPNIQQKPFAAGSASQTSQSPYSAMSQDPIPVSQPLQGGASQPVFPSPSVQAMSSPRAQPEKLVQDTGQSGQSDEVEKLLAPDTVAGPR